MKAKTAIVTVFALVLAAAAVCGEQHRLRMEASMNDDAPLKTVDVSTRKG
ncbi:MAG: hypothetical protein GWP60_01005 [Gammaproteobacteria bacterium]|nr:hypothetical protein [Gammaproteobacteria bacterium]